MTLKIYLFYSILGCINYQLTIISMFVSFTSRTIRGEELMITNDHFRTSGVRITSHARQGKHIFKVHLENPLKAQINKQRGKAKSGG